MAAPRRQVESAPECMSTGRTAQQEKTAVAHLGRKPDMLGLRSADKEQQQQRHYTAEDKRIAVEGQQYQKKKPSLELEFEVTNPNAIVA